MTSIEQEKTKMRVTVQISSGPLRGSCGDGACLGEAMERCLQTHGIPEPWQPIVAHQAPGLFINDLGSRCYYGNPDDLKEFPKEEVQERLQFELRSRYEQAMEDIQKIASLHQKEGVVGRLLDRIGDHLDAELGL